MRELRQEGFQARPTSHPHFPVDTGLVVATRLLDPEGKFDIAQVSLNLYGTTESVEKVGAAAVRAAKNGSGGAKESRIAVLAIGGLSSHPHRTWINPERDAISSPGDEQLNRRVLDYLAEGHADALWSAREAIVARGAMDGQLRALSFLHGAVGLARPAEVMAYAPVWGMGAAVVRWTSPSQLNTDNPEEQNTKGTMQ